MEQNKKSFYLKYAIGEIVLVVIGILIALQINNWNETNKSEKIESVLLHQLLEENKQNLSQLNLDKPNRDSLTLKMYALAKFLKDEDLESKTEELKTQLAELFRSTAYSFSNNYLLSYINSNNSTNSFLTKEVIELEGNQKNLTYISEKAMDSRFENIFNVLIKDLDFFNLNIESYETLKSLEFRNKILIITAIEQEVNVQFERTLKQQKKVDSLITVYLTKN